MQGTQTTEDMLLMMMTNGEHIRISATHVRITRLERRVLLSLQMPLLRDTYGWKESFTTHPHVVIKNGGGSKQVDAD